MLGECRSDELLWVDDTGVYGTMHVLGKSVDEVTEEIFGDPARNETGAMVESGVRMS